MILNSYKIFFKFPQKCIAFIVCIIGQLRATPNSCVISKKKIRIFARFNRFHKWILYLVTLLHWIDKTGGRQAPIILVIFLFCGTNIDFVVLIILHDLPPLVIHISQTWLAHLLFHSCVTRAENWQIAFGIFNVPLYILFFKYKKY